MIRYMYLADWPHQRVEYTDGFFLFGCVRQKEISVPDIVNYRQSYWQQVERFILEPKQKNYFIYNNGNYKVCSCWTSTHIKKFIILHK